MASTAASIAVFYGCAQQPSYRTPVPLSSSPAANSRTPYPSPPPPVAAQPPIQETARRTFPQEATIREQDIRAKAPPSGAKEIKEPTRQASVVEPAPAQTLLPPPLTDDSSLLAKITAGTSPQRAASLRLTEEGRKILDAGEPAKALTRLEKTIVIDSTNPYGYFYLAKAQYRLGHYKESLNFLDVAESRIGSEPFWLAEIHALRGENYRAQGQLQRAEASYNQALRFNSGNRTAADALTRIQADSSAATK
ncbi:MAG TPA: tetratricopeptide repeat protein [Candidatus Binatus sp.]|nr:tetratricopeptide repeat protein [Candidatus Binatus sp.]